MAYYETCPRCGANLDPGERCDCQPKPMYLTIQDVADRWACSTDLVRRLLRTGELPGMKIGNIWRVAVATLEQFEANRTKRPEPVMRTGERQPVLRL